MYRLLAVPLFKTNLPTKLKKIQIQKGPLPLNKNPMTNLNLRLIQQNLKIASRVNLQLKEIIKSSQKVEKTSEVSEIKISVTLKAKGKTYIQENLKNKIT